MTHAVHPTRLVPHVTRRNAILVALSIPLVLAQCAEEGARLREDVARGTGNEDHQPQTALEGADAVTADAR